MTQDEQDEKEFEDWWSKFNLDTLYTSKGEGKEWCRQAFLASRRLMREQLGKWHDVEEFYKEENKDE